MDNTYSFIEALSTKAPVPGGGGASALMGAVSAALCSMVANLTSGKKKYAQYQEDIERIIEDMRAEINVFLGLIEKDAQVFYPLSQAYSIPKDEPGRDEILENALAAACSAPLGILREAYKLLDIMKELKAKGSKLAVSDVGVAATACRAAAEGAAMNVYINTRLMKNREYAAQVDTETGKLLTECTQCCDKLYGEIVNELKA